MPTHTTQMKLPSPPPPIEHTLVLSDAEAYQIWYLSTRSESGDSFPKQPHDPERQEYLRAHQFFGAETIARFQNFKERGVSPLQYLREETR